MILIKFPLVLLLAVFDHANSQKNPKPLHQWDFRKDCPDAGDAQEKSYLGIKDRGSASIKAHGLLLGGASCASNNTEGISIKAPSDCAPFACKAGQYVSIGSLGVWEGPNWSFEAYLKFETIFNGPVQRVFDFSGPGTPADIQRYNVMLNTNNIDGVLFELWGNSNSQFSRCEVQSGFFVQNVWIHVVATVSEAGRKIYKNGENATATCDDLIYSPFQSSLVVDSNYIGRSTYYLCRFPPVPPYCGAYENFDGNIAYIRIYNKELNATEVQRLYNARNN